MKFRFPRTNKLAISLVPWLILCTGMNILFLRLSERLHLPIYFDAVGTILISFVWGSLPGITVAVITNTIYSYFSPDSLCFALIGVFIAIRSAAYIQRDKRNLQSLFCLIADLAVLTGAMGTLLQWLLLGEPQFAYVADTARLMAGDNKTMQFFSSLLLVIGLNLVDKAVSVTISIILYRIFPEKSRIKLWNSRWKQTPLSNSEIKDITSDKKDGSTSLRVKVVFLMMLIAVLISIVLGAVSARINYEEAVEEGRNTVVDVTRFGATLLDPASFERFLEDGEKTSKYGNGKYKQYNKILLDLRASFPDLEYLYVQCIKEDGVYAIFDTDDKFQKNGVIGEKYDFDETFLDQVPHLLKGERVPVKEGPGQFGYLITAYEPIPDKDGNTTTYYIGADISLDNYYQYIRSYIIKMTLSFSGFFALILAYGLWMATHSLVFPIGTLERSIDDLVKGIDDQEKLDESVKTLEKIDIRTNDEIERLYGSVREMANTVAEQMRSIRILARSNEKMQTGLIVTMADIVENQNINSRVHIKKTTAYVRIILDGLKRKGYYSEKLTDKYISDVEMTSPLYDIGKIKIPDAILNKPTALNDEEKEILKTHTSEGKKILENAITTVEGENYLKEARNMAAYHHENWDGTGYPLGLHGEVIPLSARVMAIADTFDELTSPRVYKKPISLQEALDVIREGEGTRFDPKCVEVFVSSFTEVKNVFRKYPEE